jgi:hypothetical protein
VPEEPDSVVFVRMEPGLKERLERAAAEEDLRVAQLVRRIIREWLDRRDAAPLPRN